MAKTNVVIGAGAVGTLIAAYLQSARRRVQIKVLPDEVDAMASVSSIQIDRVTGAQPDLLPKPGLATSLDLADVDNLFICVKYPDLDSVLAELPEALPPGLRVISCLNGVGVARSLRQRYPNNEIVSMAILFNAQVLEPLHVRMTTKPQVMIDACDKEIVELFSGSGMKIHTGGGEAAAWGKLLINLANAICALTHTTFYDLTTNKDLTKVFVTVLDEATAVLDVAGIDYKIPVPLPYSAYRLLLLHGGDKAPWWFTKFGKGLNQSSFPSMVADVARGKPTEIDQLNGEIVALAAKHDFPVPANQYLVERIKALQGRKLTSYMEPRELLKSVSAGR